jgi:serine/threonine-protein kinase HipA
MRRAKVFVQGIEAGILTEIESGKRYHFQYLEDYHSHPVSLTMPVNQKQWDFDSFPSFLEGLLPEGNQLKGLLNIKKIDHDDYFSQLIAVGEDMIGAVTAKEIKE